MHKWTLFFSVLTVAVFCIACKSGPAKDAPIGTLQKIEESPVLHVPGEPLISIRNVAPDPTDDTKSCPIAG